MVPKRTDSRRGIDYVTVSSFLSTGLKVISWDGLGRLASDPLKRCRNRVFPNVAKAGGFQSRGAKGEAVALYCNPLAALDLEASGFPARVETLENYGLIRNSHLVKSSIAGK